MEKFTEILNEAIDMEYNVAELYEVFAEKFTDDELFWEKIAKEEIKHAEILEGVKLYAKVFEEDRKYLYTKHEVLKKLNIELREKIELFRSVKTDKKTAYEYAYVLESSAFELHFQNMTEDFEKSEMLRKVSILAGDDKDHADRIEKLIRAIKD